MREYKKSKRLFAGVLAFMLMILVQPCSSHTVYAVEEDAQKYVVTMKSEMAYENIKKEYENELTKNYEQGDLLAEESVAVIELSEKEARKLEKKKEVVMVEEDIEFTATGKKNSEKKMEELRQLKKAMLNRKNNDNADKEEWNMKMLGITGSEVKKVTAGNQIKVAVLDSGIDTSEEVDVQEHINLVTEESDIGVFFEDMTGHGTGVAGIIADINGEAQVYSIKVLDQQNRASLSRILEGIYWCIDNDMDIINMSFGTSLYSKSLHEAVKCAEEAGILMVASAGNGGTGSDVEYPAAYEEVIAVGAVDTSAEKTEESATGEEVELVAPGEQIQADGAFGGKIVTAGTSMAVPHVVGIASVLWQKDARKSADFIRGLLKESTKHLGEKESYGEGLPDLEYALEHYEEYVEAYSELAKESVDVDVLEENCTEVETFEEVDYVEGRWGKSAHEGIDFELVGDHTYTAVEIGFIRKCASLSDENGTEKNPYTMTEKTKTYDDYFKYDGIDKSKKNQCLHGGQDTDYVANTSYLYEIAARLKRNPGWSVTKAIDAVTYKGKNKKEGNMIKRAVKFACKEFLEYSTEKKWLGYNKLSVADKRAYIVLGMALHLAADTYAHQTVVPKSALKNNVFKKSEYNRWSDFTAKINNKQLRFKDIRDYMKKPYNIDDYTSFYGKRYTCGALDSMSWILLVFDFGPEYNVAPFYWFTDIVNSGGGEECRLYKLKTYSIQIYGKKDVGSYCDNDTIAD